MLKKQIFLIFAMVFPLLAGAATVSGKVTYTGAPTKPEPLNMAAEPTCQKEHASSPVANESVVTGPNNALANVVVYVSAGDSGQAKAPAHPVTYDQKGCQYIPHVVVVQANQDLKITNDDHFLHNIHPLPKLNTEWNKAQPAGAPPIDVKFDKEEFIPVNCNIHPWMHGYFVVLKTSHYSLTKDNGSFSLPDLPPGKYTITAWHEKYGKQTQDVTISGNETKTIDFSFKAL